MIIDISCGFFIQVGDFDSQRIVVFDRMKGSVITNGPTAKEIVSWLKKNPSYMIVFTPTTKKETVSQSKQKCFWSSVTLIIISNLIWIYV